MVALAGVTVAVVRTMRCTTRMTARAHLLARLALEFVHRIHGDLVLAAHATGVAMTSCTTAATATGAAVGMPVSTPMTGAATGAATRATAGVTGVTGSTVVVDDLT